MLTIEAVNGKSAVVDVAVGWRSLWATFIMPKTPLTAPQVTPSAMPGDLADAVSQLDDESRDLVLDNCDPYALTWRSQSADGDRGNARDRTGR